MEQQPYQENQNGLAVELHQEDIKKIIDNKSIDEKLQKIWLSRGGQYLNSGEIHDALDAYEKAGVEIPKEKLVECADIAAKKAWLDQALLAYEKAGMVVSSEKAIEWAEYYITQFIKNQDMRKKGAYAGDPEEFIDLIVKTYELIDARDKIIEFVEKNLVNDGRYSDIALQIYKKIGAKDKIIKMGNMRVDEGNLDAALKAYKTAGVEIPKEKLIECGSRYLQGGISRSDAEAMNIKEEVHHVSVTYYRVAIKAFQMAGAKEKMVEVADMLGEDVYPDEAVQAYKAAGVEISKEKLIEWGNIYITKGSERGFVAQLDLFRFALRSFEMAGAKEKMVEVADYYIKEGRFEDALETYKKAGVEMSREKLIECGDKEIKDGNLEGAIRTYKKAGVELSKERLVECGNSLLQQRDTDRNYIMLATKAFQMAGAKEKMVEVGDNCIKLGMVDEAMQIYEKAKSM